MWTIQEVMKRLRQESLWSQSWGIKGESAVTRVEGELGVQLGQQLRDFVREVGNLDVAPFSIVVAGDEGALFSAVTQTRQIWTNNPHLAERKLIKVMEHAGEDYFYDPATERVCAYDGFRPEPGEETMRWGAFSAFVEWVLDEAMALHRDLGAQP